MAALISFVVLRYLELPDKAENSLCLSRRLLNFSCPGCGLTRAFAALADFDLRSSLAYHPLGLVFVVQGFLIWIGWGLVQLEVVHRPADRTVTRWLFLQLVLLLAVWAGRLATGSLPR
ncbi:MAG TPA: DUF2752 domain-containing protein [Acidobacteriota bacterium]|jgi:hypothetical protein|nr:DUF2752 domain-containing protein [Acidobacteriota bacterium]